MELGESRTSRREFHDGIGNGLNAIVAGSLGWFHASFRVSAALAAEFRGRKNVTFTATL